MREHNAADWFVSLPVWVCMCVYVFVSCLFVRSLVRLVMSDAFNLYD